MTDMIEKAKILIEALPYIKRFNTKTIVVKYGGAAMVEEELKKSFALDLVLLKYVGINPVVIHGGGPQINEMMGRLGIQPRFVNGLRVTDEESMGVVEMVLAGIINKEIVALINFHGGKAVGLTGKDGELLKAKKITGMDIGLVGDVAHVDTEIVKTLQEKRFIPVISPVASDDGGATYNINADRVASAVGASLEAEKLILLTDINGVKDRDGKLLKSLDRKKVQELIAEGVIKDGMLEKVNACLHALEGGVKKVHIIDGRIPHAVLLEIFTDEGIGTEIFG